MKKNEKKNEKRREKNKYATARWLRCQERALSTSLRATILQILGIGQGIKINPLMAPRQGTSVVGAPLRGVRGPAVQPSAHGVVS